MEYEKMLEVARAFDESIKRPIRIFRPCKICGREATLGKIEEKKGTLFLCDAHRKDRAKEKRHIYAWRDRLKKKHGINLKGRGTK